MKLHFNLEDIQYIKLYCINNGHPDTIKLALKEKKEFSFTATAPANEDFLIETPQKVSISFVCNDGLYKTTTTIEEIIYEGNSLTFEIANPESLDFQQNREYYRVLAEYDCIYTIDTGDDVESYNATTYDLSAGGVSIITQTNIIPTRETSIIICMPTGDLKAHLKFVRCEAWEDDYKMSFVFTDLTDKDYETLSKLCINKQLYSF